MTALYSLFWWCIVPLLAGLVFLRLIVPRLILPRLDPDGRLHALLAYLVEASSDLTGWLRSTMTPGAPAADGPGDGPAVASDPAKPVQLPPPPAVLPPPEAGAPAGVPSAGGAQSDVLYAIDALVGEASSGDIMACRRVIATFAVIGDGMGNAARRLAQRFGDTDKGYGSEIWEPIAGAGSQFRAGGMRLAEADGFMLSLINATLREMAESPRRAPHSSQLNGGNH